MFSSHAKPLDDFFSSFIYPVLAHSMWRSASVVVLQFFCYVYSLSLELHNMNSFWFIGSFSHLRFTSVWWSQNIKHQLAFLPVAGAKNKIAQQEENDMHSGASVVSGLARGVSLTGKKQISWHRVRIQASGLNRSLPCEQHRCTYGPMYDSQLGSQWIHLYLYW